MQINRQDDPAANTINGQVGTTDAIKSRIEAGSNAPAIDRARMYEVEHSTQTEITMRPNELEGMFEAMADGVCIYDTEGNIVHANTALREINQRMKEFLSIASHELRTPLAVVKGNVQLAQRRLQRFVGHTETPSEQMSRQVIENFQKLLEEANSQTKLLDRLVSDLLDSSRSHTGQLTLRTSPCDLAAIVRAAVEELSLINPTRSIRLQMMPEGAIPLIADSDRIKQVMMNYLNNALIYSEPDRPVEVELKVEGTEASVSVRDQGPGLAEEELKRVWERFYRVQGISQSGLGLGLHICNMIIRWHGGAGWGTEHSWQGLYFLVYAAFSQIDAANLH